MVREEGGESAGGGPARGAGVERGLLALAWPLIVSFWFRAALTWVDRAYASRIEGFEDASQAAIGLVQPFEFLMIAAWVGTSNALTSRLSAAIGAGESGRVEQWKRASRWLVRGMVAAFVAIALGIWFGAEHVGLEPAVARQFRLYASVLVGGSAFTMFWSILPDSIVKAHQDTRTTMWSGILSSVLNVGLNTLFLFAFGWGITGLAVGTVLGRLGGFLFAKAMADRHERRRVAEYGRDDGTRIARPVKALLAIAIPSGLTYVLMSAEGFLINGMLVGERDSQELLAAWSIWDAALRLMLMPAVAIGVAVLPLAARRRARGDFAGLGRELRVGLALVAGYAVVIVWPMVALGGEWAAGALLESPRAAALASAGLDVLPLVLVCVAPVFVARPVYDAIGFSRRGLGVSAVRSLLFIVPATWIGGAVALTLGRERLEGFFLGFGAGGLLGTLLIGLTLVRVLAAARASASASAPARAV